uniref:Uncharacterized protein LOC100178652 n=1 Tax=Phallusia mammillata TaxID=59560 RepID=A0A6F9DHK6_9ASCI|nr:uncharacterized protein LOC100178652 [Phallusia mammillata]
MRLELYWFLVFYVGSCLGQAENCTYKRFNHSMIDPKSSHRPFEIGNVATNFLRARDVCDKNEDCQAIVTGIHEVSLFVTTSDENGLKFTDDEECVVWMKMCPGDLDYLLRQAPDIPGYYEPIWPGTREPAMDHFIDLGIVLKQHADLLLNDQQLDETPEQVQATTSYAGFNVTLRHIPFPGGFRVEDVLESWCTYEKCAVSPRTYYHPVTANFSIVGITDVNGQGHVLLLDESHSPYKHVTTDVDGEAAMVAGIHGFHDESFAVLLYLGENPPRDTKMYLQFYRSDLSVKWSSQLKSAIAVPDRTVGDFRLSYGAGFFAAYFSVFGIDNFANATNGEQLYFVNDDGKVKSTSYQIPGQEFVTSGDAWGCSHALAQLVGYHSIDNQFLTVCAADLYPKGISIGDSVAGTLLFKADGNGRGFSTAQLGQLAEADFGWKLIFNAQDADCCPGQGVGFMTIYNENDQITGKQAFDSVVWLTNSDGKTERDPAMARLFEGDINIFAEEKFLVGWKTNEEFSLGVVNSFGMFLKNPVLMTGLSIEKDNFICTDHCVSWGNRDDSFKTLPNGKAAWISTEALSNTFTLYEVGLDESAIAGWSLWSGWSQCSRSCGTGTTTRVRSCVSGDCNNGGNSESAPCNTDVCTVPIKCTFEIHEEESMQGDLFVNGELQFAFTQEAGQEQCAMFRDLCAGITRTISGGFYFYFLKTSMNRTTDARSTSYTMTCKENPGWAQWSTWTSCTVTCGGGTKKRTRFCDGDAPGSEVCKGSVEEVETCRTGRCPTWSPWNRWSTCSETCNQGSQSRDRVCTGDYPDACGTLIGPNSETRTCTLGRCPVWLEWSDWSECSLTCGDGFQERSRECSGDFPCPVTEDGLGADQNRVCNLGVCPYWSPWSQWSICGASCGDSERFRVRDCLGDFPAEVGCPLVGEIEQKEPCNLGQCPYWGLWTAWGSCTRTCGEGTRRRSRDCLGDFSIEFCPPGDASEQEGCTLGECAKWDDWVAWSQCSKSCGRGEQTRSRGCVGDFPCPDDEPANASVPCNLGECPSWGSWGPWGGCSVTCGNDGLRERNRECLGDFPWLCDDAGYVEDSSCVDVTPCPRWSGWSQWGQCSESCDQGVTTRTRRCGAGNVEICDIGAEDPNPANGRNVVIRRSILGFYEGTESQNCSLGQCSYWLDWGAWSSCSATCDEGKRTRDRECFGDFPNMCLALGSGSETEKCTRGRCGSWNSWSQWGTCSASCGIGNWTRSRDCLGDFADTCVGDAVETIACDVSDCIAECTPNPCQNGGACRRNFYLTRLYHCVCRPGWMGKHCEYAGPDLICGSESIIVGFDRRVVSDEGLISTDPNYVSLASRESPDCVSYIDYFNTTDWYLVIVPSPIDASCGSTMEVTPNEYRIRNQVIWQADDKRIRSTVILVDFTCVYQRDVIASSAAAADGPLSIESYKREIELVTASGIFDVDISLFRDSTYQRPLLPTQGSSLVSLSEGEVVFVSVDLRSRDLLPSDDAVLVMDNCFVTSSQSTREPLTYLFREKCPVSPFVTVLSNGQSRSGRFSVRIFGWTGRDVVAENVFIHCTVSVCDGETDSCIPQCSSRRGKRSLTARSTHTNHRATLRNEASAAFHKLRTAEKRGNSPTRQAVEQTGKPFMAVVDTVPPLEDGNAAVNLSTDISRLKFDPDKMVSAGPLEIFLMTGESSYINFIILCSLLLA